MVVYICTKFHENVLDGIKSYRVDMIFIGKISKGHNSVKNVGRVTVLFLCTASDSGLYLYKVSRKYSGRYQSLILIRTISKAIIP